MRQRVEAPGSAGLSALLSLHPRCTDLEILNPLQSAEFEQVSETSEYARLAVMLTRTGHARTRTRTKPTRIRTRTKTGLARTRTRT